MRVYVAGPMTGLPQLNYPAFHAVAEVLRRIGYEVESPAENDAPVSGEWRDWMRLGLTQMLRCDTVATLKGWKKSKGARLEVQVASALGIPVVTADYLFEVGAR